MIRQNIITYIIIMQQVANHHFSFPLERSDKQIFWTKRYEIFLTSYEGIKISIYVDYIFMIVILRFNENSASNIDIMMNNVILRTWNTLVSLITMHLVFVNWFWTKVIFLVLTYFMVFGCMSDNDNLERKLIGWVSNT